MKESIMMKEIRKAKEELSEQAKRMSKDEFLEFIRKEAVNAKKISKKSVIIK